MQKNTFNNVPQPSDPSVGFSSQQEGVPLLTNAKEEYVRKIKQGASIDLPEEVRENIKAYNAVIDEVETVVVAAHSPQKQTAIERLSLLTNEKETYLRALEQRDAKASDDERDEKLEAMDAAIRIAEEEVQAEAAVPALASSLIDPMSAGAFPAYNSSLDHAFHPSEEKSTSEKEAKSPFSTHHSPTSPAFHLPEDVAYAFNEKTERNERFLFHVACMQIDEEDIDLLNVLFQLPCDEIKMHYESARLEANIDADATSQRVQKIFMMHEQITKFLQDSLDVTIYTPEHISILKQLIKTGYHTCYTDHAENVAKYIKERKTFSIGSRLLRLTESDEDRAFFIRTCRPWLASHRASEQESEDACHAIMECDTHEKLTRYHKQLWKEFTAAAAHETIKQQKLDEVAIAYVDYITTSYQQDRAIEQQIKTEQMHALFRTHHAKKVLDVLECNTQEEAEALLLSSTLSVNTLGGEHNKTDLLEYAKHKKSSAQLYLKERRSYLASMTPRDTEKLKEKNQLLKAQFSWNSDAERAAGFHKLAIVYETTPTMPHHALWATIYYAKAYCFSRRLEDKTAYHRWYQDNENKSEHKKTLFECLLRAHWNSGGLLTLLQEHRFPSIKAASDISPASKPLMAYVLGHDLNTLFDVYEMLNLEITLDRYHLTDQTMLFHILREPNIPPGFKFSAIDRYLNAHGLEHLDRQSPVAKLMGVYLRESMCQRPYTNELSVRNVEKKPSDRLEALIYLDGSDEDESTFRWSMNFDLSELIKKRVQYYNSPLSHLLQKALLTHAGIAPFETAEMLLDAQLDVPLHLRLRRSHTVDVQEAIEPTAWKLDISRAALVWMLLEALRLQSDPSIFSILSNTYERLLQSGDLDGTETQEAIRLKNEYSRSAEAPGNGAFKKHCKDLNTLKRFIKFYIGGKAELPPEIFGWYEAKDMSQDVPEEHKAIGEHDANEEVPQEHTFDISPQDPTVVVVDTVALVLASYLSCLRFTYLSMLEGYQPAVHKEPTDRLRYFLHRLLDTEEQTSFEDMQFLLAHPIVFENGKPEAIPLNHALLRTMLPLNWVPLQPNPLQPVIDHSATYIQISIQLDQLLSTVDKRFHDYMKSCRRKNNEQTSAFALKNAFLQNFLPSTIKTFDNLNAILIIQDSIKRSKNEQAGSFSRLRTTSVQKAVEKITLEPDFDKTLGMQLAMLSNDAFETSGYQPSMVPATLRDKVANEFYDLFCHAINRFRGNESHHTHETLLSIIQVSPPETTLVQKRLEFSSGLLELYEAFKSHWKDNEDITQQAQLISYAGTQLVNHYEEQIALVKPSDHKKLADFFARMFCLFMFSSMPKQAIEDFFDWLELGANLMYQKVNGQVHPFTGETIHLLVSGEEIYCMSLVRQSGYKCRILEEEKKYEDDAQTPPVWFAVTNGIILPDRRLGYKRATSKQIKCFMKTESDEMDTRAELDDARARHVWYPHPHSGVVVFNQRWYLTQITIKTHEYQPRDRNYAPILNDYTPAEQRDSVYATMPANEYKVVLATKNHQIDRQKRQIAQLREKTDEYKIVLAEKGGQIAQLEEKLAATARQAEVAIKVAVQEKDAAISRETVATMERDAAIRDKNLTDREGRLAAWERDRAIEERDDAIQDRDDAIQDRDLTIRERDLTARERDDALREKNDILRQTLEKKEARRRKNEELLKREENMRKREEEMRQKEEKLRQLEPEQKLEQKLDREEFRQECHEAHQDDVQMHRALGLNKTANALKDYRMFGKHGGNKNSPLSLQRRRASMWEARTDTELCLSPSNRRASI